VDAIHFPHYLNRFYHPQQHQYLAASLPTGDLVACYQILRCGSCVVSRFRYGHMTDLGDI